MQRNHRLPSAIWRNWSVTHTATEDNAWWQLDLGAQYVINEIIIYNRTDNCCTARLSDFEISMLDAEGNLTYIEQFSNVPNPSIGISFEGLLGKL